MRQHVISTLALGTKTNCQEPLGRGLPWYLAVLQAIALLSFPDSLKFRGPSSLEEPSFGGFFFLGSFCQLAEERFSLPGALGLPTQHGYLGFFAGNRSDGMGWIRMAGLNERGRGICLHCLSRD